MVTHFWDSYAIVELIDGNKNYARYSEEPVFLTIFNLAEVYWYALNENEENADEIYDKFRRGIVDISDEILKDSIKFRKKHKGKNLSYTDCIGYVFALKNDMKFLTGDRAFEKMENVEFVK